MIQFALSLSGCLKFLGPLCKAPIPPTRYRCSLYTNEELRESKRERISGGTVFVELESDLGFDNYVLRDIDGSPSEGIAKDGRLVFQAALKANQNITLSNTVLNTTLELVLTVSGGRCDIRGVTRRKTSFRIGFVSKIFTSGGLERVTQLLATNLAASGHTLFVITGPAHEKDYALPDNVRRVVLADFDNMILGMTEIARLQLDVIVFQQYYTMENYEYINSYARNGMKVVAIDHNVYLWALIDNPQFVNPQTLTTTREIEAQRHKYYPIADAVAVLSPFDALVWQRAGVRARYIPNPTTYPVHDIEDRFGKNVLWVGRMQNIKQPGMALDMMKTLNAINPAANLVMVGDLHHEMAWYVERDNIANVQVHGFTLDIDRFYKNASVLVITSQYEGYGMVIAEALSHGVPVVSFEMPYLTLMSCGVVQVEKSNVAQMAHEVNKLLQNETRRQKLAKFGQECLQKQNELVVPRWNELLSKVVNGEEVDFPDEADEKWVDDILFEEVKFLFNATDRQMMEAKRRQKEEHRRQKAQERIQKRVNNI